MGEEHPPPCEGRMGEKHPPPCEGRMGEEHPPPCEGRMGEKHPPPCEGRMREKHPPPCGHPLQRGGIAGYLVSPLQRGGGIARDLVPPEGGELPGTLYSPLRRGAGGMSVGEGLPPRPPLRLRVARYRRPAGRLYGMLRSITWRFYLFFHHLTVGFRTATARAPTEVKIEIRTTERTGQIDCRFHIHVCS